MHSNSVAEFNILIDEYFTKFYQLSQQIGGLVKEQCELVRNALDTQMQFLDLASQSQKPVENKMMELLKPTSELINKIIAIRDKNRKDEYFNLLSAVAEGIGALGWVSIAPTPAPYIKEMSDSAQFYTNKVLIAYKQTNVTMVDWAKSWIEFLSQLQQYVRKNHTTGLVWNAKGAIIKNEGGVPPPPPPPPADFFDDKKNGNSSNGQHDSRAALFASINQGSGITKGLRKVTSDQQTHKNASLRQSGVVSDRKTTALCQKDPRMLNPILKLEGKKWMVENQFQKNNLLIDDTEMIQSVHVFNCQESVLTVKGKVNFITVDKCKKFSIIFDNVLSVVEFINSQRLQAQVNGVVPTITVDKVDGIEIYMSKESLSCEIVSSKSSEINVSVKKEGDEDYVEHPLPEQFKSIWNGNGFKTVALEKN